MANTYFLKYFSELLCIPTLVISVYILINNCQGMPQQISGISTAINEIITYYIFDIHNCLQNADRDECSLPGTKTIGYCLSMKDCPQLTSLALGTDLLSQFVCGLSEDESESGVKYCCPDTVKSRALPTECEPGFEPFQGYCYGFLDETRNSWQEGEDLCKSLQPGSHLLTVHNQEENDFVSNRLDDVLKGSSYGYVWLGINDLADEGTLVNSDGSAVDYTNWAGRSIAEIGNYYNSYKN
jgi:hypothetical protein